MKSIAYQGLACLNNLPQLRQDIINVISPLHGWCNAEKAIAMAELVLEKHPNTIVEIGVFGGRSLIPQAMALRENKKGTIYGIDSWRTRDTLEGNISDADKEWWSKSVDLHGIHASCMDAIWAAGVDQQCVIIRNASQHVPKLFPGGIDILHIDGCHSEQSSVRDVQLYVPQMNYGSYIWFDDASWPTTQKAIGLLREKYVPVRKVDDCVLFQKKFEDEPAPKAA
jgi:predicted O-methyltransferase YrrM